MQVHVGIEVDAQGQAMAWVGELPGCYTRGRTASIALEKIPLAVYEYCVWLQAHGEEMDPPGDVKIVDVQTVLVTSDLGQAESQGLFQFDVVPAPGMSSLAMRAAHYARADLLDLLPQLGPSLPAPPLEGTTRSISQTLDHLLLADLWYAIRLLPPDSLEGRDYLLRAVRDACVPAMAEWAEDDKVPAPVHVYTQHSLEWDRVSDPESWTGYKALRRYVWHDRLHYRNLSRRLGPEGPHLT